MVDLVEIYLKNIDNVTTVKKITDADVLVNIDNRYDIAQSVVNFILSGDETNTDNNSDIVGVVFNDALITVGDSAFSNCTKLESLIFRGGDIILGDNSFFSAGANHQGTNGVTIFYKVNSESHNYSANSFQNAKIVEFRVPNDDFDINVNSGDPYFFRDTTTTIDGDPTLFTTDQFYGSYQPSLSSSSADTPLNTNEPLPVAIVADIYIQPDFSNSALVLRQIYSWGVDGAGYYAIYQESVDALFSGITNNAGVQADRINVVGVIFDDYKINVSDNAFAECTYLETLIFRGAEVTLGLTSFENAGMNTTVSGPSFAGPGITIFYSVDTVVDENNTTQHSYDSTSFQGATISEFLIPAESIVIGTTTLQTDAMYDSFFGSFVPGVGSGEAATPVTQSTTEPPPCFVAGTMIDTDQGCIAIEKVKTYHTIRGMSISRVTKRLSENNLVLIKKDAFGINRPNKDTLSSHWHGVYLKDSDKEFVRLIDLVDNKRVIEQYYKFEYVYNIELKDKHSYMHANNLKVETLIPGHP